MRAVRRLLWREALFLWMRPLVALESSVEVAACSAASAPDLSPDSISLITFLTEVRISERWETLCWLRFTAWRARFFADLMFATGFSLEHQCSRKCLMPSESRGRAKKGR